MHKTTQVEYLHKEVNRKHILWFAPSNQWLQLDEPQWFIFLLYEQGVGAEEAARSFAARWGVAWEQAQQQVSGIYLSLRQLYQPEFELPDFSCDAEEVAHVMLEKSKTRYYSFAGMHFGITYGSALLDHYIHPSLAHLACTPAAGMPVFEVFPFRERYALRIRTQQLHCFTTDEYPQLKRLLFVKMASAFYDLNERHWTGLLHASAVERNGKVLLLASPSGSGKSTLAAMLLQYGFGFFSDDFVPVEKSRVYPFPASLCLKEVSHWPLPGVPPFHRTLGKTGYIDPPPSFKLPEPLAAKALCFVNYIPGAGCNLEALPTERAMQLFLPESWVGDRPETAKAWLDWFCQLPCYQLQYHDNAAAIAAMQKLMDTP
ncbi:MAG: hypothetical protein ACK4VN_00265 [Bacteroidales bacterium]